MFTKNNQIKSIKWKHAFLVVILLHGVGYLSIAQYSNYKKQKALELKKAREELYANNETKTIEWPKNEKSKPMKNLSFRLNSKNCIRKKMRSK